ncbi:MAG: aminoglycoside phosphotransferase family protein [Phycisphaerales bacterium]
MPQQPPHHGNTHDLAVMLEPALHCACGGNDSGDGQIGKNSRLGSIEWFHASWQRGGAATGFSTYRMHDYQGTKDTASLHRGAMIKLPLSPSEYHWTTSLGCVAHAEFDSPHACNLPVPRVFAHGVELGGHDLAWVICERLTGDHMPKHMRAQQVEELMSRVFAFHQLASQVKPVTRDKVHTPDWGALLEKSRDQCRQHLVAEYSQWADAIRKVQRALPALKNRWDDRELDTWCHGDLHPGNALMRTLPDGSQRCVLIDLALVHPGHWIEDALYLERQYWGHEDWLDNAKPISILARLRREAGLPTHGDYTMLANVRRVLMAACAPGVIDREGANAKYLHRAWTLIEQLLPQIPH